LQDATFITSVALGGKEKKNKEQFIISHENLWPQDLTLFRYTRQGIEICNIFTFSNSYCNLWADTLTNTYSDTLLRNPGNGKKLTKCYSTFRRTLPLGSCGF
jgi:hypothetical protein